MSGAPHGATRQALWNMRAFGLVLIGPVVGVALVADLFGLPRPLLAAAAAMFLFSLGLFAVLVRGERQRLVRLRRPRAG